MKIAIDVRTASGQKAGKGWYTFHLIHALLKLDQSNRYILYTKAGIPAFDQFPNVIQKIIATPGLLWHHKIIKDLKKEKVDLFFAPSSYIIPALIPKHTKTIVTVHDLVAILFPKTHNKKAVFIEKALLKRVLKKANHIITVSNHTKKDLHHRFKISPKKITTVYCAAGEAFKPLPQEDLKAFQSRTNLPEHFFLSVGTILPRKNHLNLIKAFAQVHKQYPDYHLVIAGKEAWKADQVHQEIYNHYLEDKVHFLSYVSQESLVALYNLATALVFPSFYEGFGIPPLEAMKSGCPVIASHTSSIPEVVGEAALLIDPNQPQEIATAMLKILKNPETSKTLIKKGFIQAQNFSWQLSARKLLNLIKNMS